MTSAAVYTPSAVERPTRENHARGCPVCGAAPSPQGGATARCASCGLLYRSAYPSRQEQDLWKQMIKEHPHIFFEEQRRDFFHGYWRLIRSLPRTSPGRPAVLDVGCVPGLLLREAAGDGWEAHGAETSREFCELTRREVPSAFLWEGRVEAIDFGGTRFDLVVVGDVARTMHDPVAALAACRRVLKPGGALVVREINALHRKHQERINHPQPTDMQFFTPGTLRAALERAGFTKVLLRSSPISGVTYKPVMGLVRRARPLYRALLGGINTAIRLSGPTLVNAAPSIVAIGRR